VAVEAAAGPKAASSWRRDPGVIEVVSGTSIQALVDRNPPGTTFFLRAGIHRMQAVVPKDGNTFLGEAGTILNGSRLLTNFSPEGGRWMTTVEVPRFELNGFCRSSSPRCGYPHAVYIDHELQRQANSIGEVDPGEFFLDYATRHLHVGTNPTGRTVELAVSPYAFEGKASSVTIRGLTIEKYANRAQLGAIAASLGVSWIIEENTVRKNHGVGIAVGPRGQVRRNAIVSNGQLGISADGESGLVEGNEIAYNNTAGFLPEWEAGGSKFAETRDLVVRGNHVHHNFGYGLWTDIDNVGTLYEGNLVTDNTHAGIFHEVSGAAEIRGNHVYRNGSAERDWLWGGQIQIAGSSDVVITGNVVVVAAGYGNGIVLVQQDRGSGPLGPRRTRRITVTSNEVIYLGDVGLTGAAADYEEAAMFTSGQILFDRNLYRFRSEPTRWRWRGNDVDLAGMRKLGQELNGSVDSRIVIPER
jgi:hypothetical protein